MTVASTDPKITGCQFATPRSSSGSQVNAITPTTPPHMRPIPPATSMTSSMSEYWTPNVFAATNWTLCTYRLPLIAAIAALIAKTASFHRVTWIPRASAAVSSAWIARRTRPTRDPRTIQHATRSNAMKASTTK